MTRSRLVSSCVVALSLLVLPVACLAQSRSSVDSRGSLGGRVSVDGESAVPQQVRVEIRMMGENWNSVALTDRDGGFRFEGIPSGTYFVSVRVPDCAPFEDTVRVDTATSPLSIRLRRNTTTALPKGASPLVSVHQLSIPSKARKSFDKGNRFVSERNPAAGISEYQQAIKEFPGFYEAYYKIGIAEIDREHGPEAEAAFRKAIELSEGKFAPALSGLSLVLCVER